VSEAAAAHALAVFGHDPSQCRIEPLGRGLIHLTLAISSPAGERVLQRMNPIFDPLIHENIHAVTQRLADRGVQSPRLCPAPDGRLWVDLGEEGVWRLFTRVPGVTFDVVARPGQARSAGRLVGLFHAALEDLGHAFVGMRLGVHDTARHLAVLREALDERSAHRLHAALAPLGEAILRGAGALPPLPPLPPRVGHGDLKFNNVLFAGAEPPRGDEAVCLVDLDTVGPIHLGYELGDAWRSWCNPVGEDRADARFDLDVFAASLEGYRAGLRRTLSADERAALLFGVEWVSLELAARFGADALRECYFGWDRRRFPAAGEHNLLRARGQWALHEAALASRTERERLLLA
jgi:Ser/Thr protein kinase RdoA (MazF antagonist)